MKTSFSRRELYAFGETLGDSVTRQVAGRRVYGAGGGGSLSSITAPSGSGTPGATGGTASPMAQTETQAGVAGYAQPYVNTMLGATVQNLFNTDASGNVTGQKGYTPYSYNPADYVAGFSPLQQQAQQGIASLQAPNQSQQATQYANQAIQGLMNQQYNPQTGGYQSVGASQLQAPNQIQAQNIGTQSFTQPGAAGQYMSPYMQNVVDTQTREAQRQADIASTKRGAQAAGAGAFGGSRMAIENAEAARNLATQKGDIQATGSQAAYNAAQQQFNAEQQARLAAAQSNQQAGLTAGQANQNVQYGTGLQNAQLAQQANLANQSAAQQAQQLAAQQQQFGANYGLQGLQSALSGANTLGGLGTTGLNNQLNVLGAQQATGATQQQQQQNIINQGVQNYQTAQQYPMSQLALMQNMLQGLPISTSSSQQYQAAPSTVSQLAGLGVAGLGLGSLMGGTGTGGSTGGGLTGALNGLGGLLPSASTVSGWGNNITDLWNKYGFAEGGQIPDTQDNAGLAHLAISKME